MAQRTGAIFPLPKRYGKNFDAVGAGLTLVSTVFMFGWLAVRPGSPQTFKLVDDIGQIVGPLLMLIWCSVGLIEFWTERRRATSPLSLIAKHRLRTSILLLLAVACNTTGQVIWSYLNHVVHSAHPFPGPADVPWVLTYVFQVSGFLSLSARPLPTRTRIRVLLDGLMMLAVLCTFSWYFQVGPMLLHSNATLLASLVGACYPLGDLLVLFCLLVIATTSSLAHREYTGLLSIGLIFVVFADTVFSYGNVHGTYVNGITDVGWPTGYMIVAYVARQLLKKAESGEDEEIRNEAYPQAHVLTWRSLLPYACIPPLGALTYYSMLSRDEPDLSAGVFFGAELLVGFLLVRQLMALVDNQRLYDSLLQANEDLSARSSEVHEYASKMEALNHELKQTQLELLTNNIALAQVNGQLEELATRDGMTGLANHRAFQARLRDDVESASKASTPIALMLLDVDRFKDYNDSFGHPAGDEVLRTLGQLIGTSARKTDIVARYGGEEFVMLLPNVTEDEARVIAERVRVVIEGHMFHLRAVTVSAGVAYHRGGNIEADQLIEIADSALYKAKRGGRNRVVFEVIGDSSAQ